MPVSTLEALQAPDFNAAALERFVEQFTAIAPYRAYCEARGTTPDTCADWRRIPLLPVSALKTAAVQVAEAVADPRVVFETSGTTDGNPGTVRLADTRWYDAALKASFRRWMMSDAPGPMRCVSLVPDGEVRPRSSLGYMVRQLIAEHGDGHASTHLRPSADGQGAVDVDSLVDALQHACRDGVPVLLFATTIALDLAMQSWPADVVLRLPAGSRLMDTGGPKARRATADRQQLQQLVASRWGIPAGHFVGELGMTELASQRYETTLRAAVVGDVESTRLYAGPPWLRTLVVDPATLQPVADGQLGMLGHLDLANVQTCAFLLTADLGRLVEVAGAGRCLELVGRAPGSALRGCGLDAESL